MSWFDDRIEDAMPYLVVEELRATAGASWQWSYTFPDAGADLGVAYEATCRVGATRTGSTSVVPVTVTFPTTSRVLCVVDNDDTSVPAARYFHEVEIKRTSDGRRLKIVGGGDSELIVKPSGGA